MRRQRVRGVARAGAVATTVGALVACAAPVRVSAGGTGPEALPAAPARAEQLGTVAFVNTACGPSTCSVDSSDPSITMRVPDGGTGASAEVTVAFEYRTRGPADFYAELDTAPRLRGPAARAPLTRASAWTGVETTHRLDGLVPGGEYSLHFLGASNVLEVRQTFVEVRDATISVEHAPSAGGR